MQCIYRKPKTLEMCGKHAIDCYCNQHKKMKNVLYDVINDIVGSKNILSERDLFAIYKHIYDNVNFTNIQQDDDAKRLFVIEIFKQMSKDKLLQIYNIYYPITKAANAYSKTTIINKLCALFDTTYRLDTIESTSKISMIQNWYRDIVYKNLFIRLDTDHQPINKEDIFTYDDIDTIPANRLFMYYDTKGNLYAFDAVELEYYVRRCRADASDLPDSPEVADTSVDIYNPFTKQVIPDDVIKKLYVFIAYYKLELKSEECIWITDLQAYTDLSIEMERRGFYNSPDWFGKFGRRELLNVVKLFKDFSVMVSESRAYFQRFDGDVFAFCKEGIKLFRECNEDKYILCCNFMKSLAMMSSDFYYNLPDWLLQTFTNSSIMARHRNNNFLLYYYVEYVE